MWVGLTTLETLQGVSFAATQEIEIKKNVTLTGVNTQTLGFSDITEGSLVLGLTEKHRISKFFTPGGVRSFLLPKHSSNQAL